MSNTKTCRQVRPIIDIADEVVGLEQPILFSIGLLRKNELLVQRKELLVVETLSSADAVSGPALPARLSSASGL
jgi:hypothetical protein